MQMTHAHPVCGLWTNHSKHQRHHLASLWNLPGVRAQVPGGKPLVFTVKNPLSHPGPCSTLLNRNQLLSRLQQEATAAAGSHFFPPKTQNLLIRDFSCQLRLLLRPSSGEPRLASAGQLGATWWRRRVLTGDLVYHLLPVVQSGPAPALMLMFCPPRPARTNRSPAVRLTAATRSYQPYLCQSVTPL